MNDTAKPAIPQEGLTFHAEVTAVEKVAFAKPPFVATLEAPQLRVRLSSDEALNVGAAYDVTIAPAPEAV